MLNSILENHSILQNSEFNTINIFGFDIVWIPHPPTVIPFLLVDSRHKNNRTNKPEIH